MEKIRVIVNRESNTLDVWFDDPEKFRKRKIEELIMLRRSFNLIQKRLHA